VGGGEKGNRGPTLGRKKVRRRSENGLSVRKIDKNPKVVKSRTSTSPHRQLVFGGGKRLLVRGRTRKSIFKGKCTGKRGLHQYRNSKGVELNTQWDHNLNQRGHRSEKVIH